MQILFIALLMVTNSLIGMQPAQFPWKQNWDGKSFHRHTKKSFPLAKEIIDRYDLSKNQTRS